MSRQFGPRPAAAFGERAGVPLRYTRVGSVLLSADFLVGLPLGAGLGFVVGQVDAIGDGAPTILLAYMAALVGLAAIVIAAHTLLVTLVTNEYLPVLERATGGLKGVSRPYRIVATVCAVGALTSLSVALVWPVVPGGYSWSRGLLFGVCTLLAGWGLVGATQLIGLGAFHLEQRASLLQILREVKQAADERRRSA